MFSVNLCQFKVITGNCKHINFVVNYSMVKYLLHLCVFCLCMSAISCICLWLMH